VYLKGVICISAWECKCNLHCKHLDHTWKYTLNLRESNCDVVYCRPDGGQIKASAGDRRQTTRCISHKEAPLFVTVVNIPRALANIQWEGGFHSPLIWIWINSFLSAFLLVVMLGRLHVILWKWSSETLKYEASDLLICNTPAVLTNNVSSMFTHTNEISAKVFINNPSVCPVRTS